MAKYTVASAPPIAVPQAFGKPMAACRTKPAAIICPARMAGAPTNRIAATTSRVVRP